MGGNIIILSIISHKMQVDLHWQWPEALYGRQQA